MNAKTEHRASCLCGQLSLTAQGEPDFVIACNCLKCQQRGGGPFGLGAYYRRDRISTAGGAEKLYQRTSDSGRNITNHFCATCGTTVYWGLEMRPDHFGVAIGCFADPDFPGPVRVIWAENKHHWVNFPDSLPVFDKAVPAP